MKNSWRTAVAPAVLFGALFAAQNAFALGSVVAGGGSSSPGGTFSVTANNFVFITARLEAGKSYACTAIPSEITDNISISSTITASGGQIDNNANGVFFRGDVSPLAGSSSQNPSTISDDRVVITPVATDSYVFSVSNNNASDTINAKFECMETTLYGGYNTNANPFNFLEITNTTGGTISGRVRGFNFDGSATANVTFSVPANSRADIDVHTAAGANKYGIIIVTHNGPYGALQAYVSQYNGPVANLNLSASTPLRPRDQTF